MLRAPAAALSLHSRPTHFHIVSLCLCVLITGILPGQTTQARLAATAPAISNIQINPSGVDLGPYDKFEVQFKVRTAATQLDLPFDANPPPGVRPGTGISVEGLFSRDNWATTLVQPAFLYQPYTHTLRLAEERAGERKVDHFVPNGGPRWMVRFAPQQAGAWAFKLRAVDAGGSTMATGGAFTVAAQSRNPNRQHGFLRVSQTDRRYFEFQDGSPFIGVGFNSAFDDSAEAAQRLQTYARHKINFLRVWLSSAGINGTQWASWSYHGAPVNYLPGTHLDTETTYNGADVSLRLDREVPCLFTDFWQGRVPVQPNTAYSISARVKLDGVTDTGSFAVKLGGWLEETCTDPKVGTILIQPRMPSGTGSTDWITLTGTYQNGDTDWLGYLYLALQDSGLQGEGKVFVDEVRMWQQADPDRVNILREPNANAHEYFDPLNAAVWDEIIASAETTGVYLKLVIDEKNEWIRNHIGPDGHMTSTKDMQDADASNDNFYAGPNTKVRWLMQAWWRYLIARWGYSTAIHSFELLNEGDPYNGRHYDAANAFARYMHQNDSARHMITTSFWHSFPGSEFWVNSQMDYADLHAYISTGWGKNASFLDEAHLETNVQNVRSGNSAAKVPGDNHDIIGLGPRGLTLRGKGEWTIRYWIKASSLTATCGFGTTGSQVRLRWRVDGGSYAGGREGIVPPNAEGKDFVCTSPGGSFGWRLFNTKIDAHGQTVNPEYRLVLADDKPHAFSISLENGNGTGGTAWLDDVEIVSPDGRVARMVGEFDTTPLAEDTAWYNRAYGEVFGAKSMFGAGMPLVRGEAGLDVGDGKFDPALLRDVDGVWLHNNLWGQVNAGGMVELFWWASETIDRVGRPEGPLYGVFAPYRNFMADVPLNNGEYVDAGAQTSSTQLRAWGQRDDVNGRMHLWVQNIQHAWKRVIDGQTITPVMGSITLTHVAAGNYVVTWWDTHSAIDQIIATQTVTANRKGELVLQLPVALADDIGVKLVRSSKVK